MKLQYLLKDTKAIDTLLTALKLLHGNNCEVLFSFASDGLSLSQGWYEKCSEKGKYFFFLEHTHFSKISCKEPNVHLEVNIKDIIQKLKSHRKDLIEVSISVYSLENEEMEEPWCTVEFYMVLKNLNSVIYRNTCKVMKDDREFIPLVYFKHIYDTKKLLMCGKAAQISFLSSWRNNFIKLLLKKDKVKFICEMSGQSIDIDPIAFFDIFNYDALASVYEGVQDMTLPPNHLLRYLKLCQKLKTYFNVYFTTSVKEENRIKLYCPLRIDQGIFVLKFSVTYYVNPASFNIESKFIPSTIDSRTEPAILQPRTQDALIPKTALRTIDSSNKKPSSRPFIKKIEPDSEPGPTDSENQVIGTTAASTRKIKNPFRFSQESGFKSVRKNDHKPMTSSLRALIPQSFIFESESVQSKSAKKVYAFNLQEEEEEEEDKKENEDAMEIETEGSIKFEPGVNGNPKSVRIRGSEISLDKVTFRKSYRITTTQAPRKTSLQPFRPEATDGENGIKRMLFVPGEAENFNKDFSKKMTSAIRTMQL